MKEVQIEQYYKKHDFENLEFFKEPIIAFDTEHNKSDLFKNLKHNQDEFPESDEDCWKICEIINERLENFLKHSENAGIVPNVVTHGFFVTYLFKKYRDEKFDEFYFCSTSCLQLNKKGKLELVELDVPKYR